MLHVCIFSHTFDVWNADRWKGEARWETKWTQITTRNKKKKGFICCHIEILDWRRNMEGKVILDLQRLNCWANERVSTSSSLKILFDRGRISVVCLLKYSRAATVRARSKPTRRLHHMISFPNPSPQPLGRIALGPPGAPFSISGRNGHGEEGWQFI